MPERPQFYENDLEPVTVDKKSLLNTFELLRMAVVHGSDLIQSEIPPSGKWDHGGIFSGVPGTLTYAIK